MSPWLVAQEGAESEGGRQGGSFHLFWLFISVSAPASPLCSSQCLQSTLAPGSLLSALRVPLRLLSALQSWVPLATLCPGPASAMGLVEWSLGPLSLTEL